MKLGTKNTYDNLFIYVEEKMVRKGLKMGVFNIVKLFFFLSFKINIKVPD